MQILLGADPEVFVFDKVTRKPVCAHGLVPGTKDEPFPVDCGAVQVDGFALEFNITPAATEDEWVNNLSSVQKQLAAMVPGFDLRYQASCTFDEDYFKAQPEEARELGCEPDYNAYTGEENVIPEGEADKPFRTAAGHIHIGWTEGKDPLDPEHFQMCCELVKQLDIWLAYPSASYDMGTNRRKLYGKAGAFRPKPYGCEYRVLSNFWLQDERKMRWVYQQVHKCIKSMQSGKKFVFDPFSKPYDSLNSPEAVEEEFAEFIRIINNDYYMSHYSVFHPEFVKLGALDVLIHKV